MTRGQRCVAPRKVVCTLQRDVQLPTRAVKTPEDAVVIARNMIGNQAFEVLLFFYGNAKSCITAYDSFTSGAPAQVSVDPRAAVRGAIVAGGSVLFSVHQHPSGDPTPSDTDRDLWRRLSQLANTLGLHNPDNFVLGVDSYYAQSRGAAVPYPDGGTLAGTVAACRGRGCHCPIKIVR